MVTTTPTPDDGDPAPSGIGTAPPAFTHSPVGGATEVGAMPMLSAKQFGVQPNWSSSPPARAKTAMAAKPGGPS